MERNNFFNGIISGFISRFFIAPFDVIKVKTQLGLINNKKILHGISKLYKKNGISIFWQGNIISSLSYSLYIGNQFWAYENSKQYFPNSPLINGINSGLFASIITYPVYAIKTRLMAQNYNIKYFTINGLKKIKLGSIYDGFFISSLATIPSTVIRFVSYENMIKYFNNNKYKVEISGGLSGFFCQVIILPMDNIEKQMQINRYHNNSKKKSIIEITKQMYNQNGFNSFYRGIKPTIVKSTFASSLIFSLYNRFSNTITT